MRILRAFVVCIQTCGGGARKHRARHPKRRWPAPSFPTACTHTPRIDDLRIMRLRLANPDPTDKATQAFLCRRAKVYTRERCSFIAECDGVWWDKHIKKAYSGKGDCRGDQAWELPRRSILGEVVIAAPLRRVIKTLHTRRFLIHPSYS
jgi:hypothetical protein